ncbi:DUF3967 domain-containing protein [Lederbergia lenta]|uniref:DUF3967 domain-containing protein n=1 Tax=Lederbergia lenta TaxID=1467 RepID=UPI00203E526A|nr:DUF3967 domain-containing protein [Lederbergia lenta]MCM3113593.1 DUF3967 domain-containing protein [Lederbergia lenta]
MTVIYRPNEVMKKFELKESLYKKYIAALEREGYIFEKNQQGHRFFTLKDIDMLENFIQLIRYDGMTIEAVAKKIGSLQQHDDIPGPQQESYDVITLVEKAVESALQIQEKQLTSKLKAEFEHTLEQLKKMESRESERDKLLMQSIRESQEVKKILLEAKEQVAAVKEENKQSWWKFWINKK